MGRADISRHLLDAARCPHCWAKIEADDGRVGCVGCGRAYPRLGQIPLLVHEPEAYLTSYRRSLALLEEQAGAVVRAIEEELRARDLLPLTRRRCQAAIDAVRGKVDDVRAVMGPLLPADGADSDSGAPIVNVPSPLKGIDYLYRDWAWPSEPGDENERAFAAIEAVLEGWPPGRTLVVGAGGCRLAYDLHRHTSGAETFVVDVDPFLFAVAHAVIRGGTVSLREANADIDEMGHVSRAWVLAAPHGAIDVERFHFVLADGLDPPFAAGAFDTLVTSWFIDLVPDDLRDFVSTVHRMLKPGGRWLNYGPLRYRPDMPVARRVTREEVFDMLDRGGFGISTWHTGTTPHLVSSINGRGKVEWVLAFAATKLDPPNSDDLTDRQPPSWLLFRHLPIPVFAGQSLIWATDPLTRIVVSAIDGHRTLDDIAAHVTAHVRQAGASKTRIRAAVRRRLADIHPGCRGESAPGRS